MGVVMASGVLGATTFVAVQGLLIWRVGAEVAWLRPDDPAWFLNSGANLAAVMLALALVAGGVAFASAHDVVARGAALAGGAALAMVGALASMGPGDLFPVVIGVGVSVIAVAVGAGAGAGAAARRWRTRVGA